MKNPDQFDIIRNGQVEGYGFETVRLQYDWRRWAASIQNKRKEIVRVRRDARETWSIMKK
jgi:hypothetical protein